MQTLQYQYKKNETLCLNFYFSLEHLNVQSIKKFDDQLVIQQKNASFIFMQHNYFVRGFCSIYKVMFKKH